MNPTTPRVQRACRGAFSFEPIHDQRRRTMFEGRQQEVDVLMKSNAEFRSLYLRHKELDKKVLDAELGVRPIDDMTLARMKKEKLHAKDRLTTIFDRHAAPN
jgi:uncharacterized protein YdcH (DUF465 family)